MSISFRIISFRPLSLKFVHDQQRGWLLNPIKFDRDWCLGHADDGVGDAGADVGAEDHRNGVTNLDAGRHQSHDDRR
jgi:hypothetical protein